MKKRHVVLLLTAAGVVLGATVFREPVAFAAQLVNATITGPLDAQGNVAVHERGVASVNVTNAELSVRQAGTPFSIMLKPPNEIFTVPAGKQLLIEYVSSFSSSDDTATLIVGQAGVPDQNHVLPTTPFSGGFVISERVTIHAGPGKQVVFFFNSNAYVTVEGYMFDA